MSSKTEILAETPLLSASKLVSMALSKLQSPTNQGGDTSAAIADLQLALKILTTLDPYLDDHSTPAPSSLDPLLEATVNEDWTARHKEGKTTFPMSAGWSAGSYEGMFVSNVARAIGAKRVLEVGMFTGTTTFCLAHHLPQGGKVVALELDQYLDDFLAPHLKRAGLQEKVQVRVGQAKDTLENLVGEVQSGQEEPFDLVFIDADKTGYEGYYNQMMDGGLLKKGGVFLVDNTLYKAAPLLAKDSQFQSQLLSSVDGIGKDNADALARFNKLVVQDKRVEATILPVRDGLTWINRLE